MKKFSVILLILTASISIKVRASANAPTPRVSPAVASLTGCAEKAKKLVELKFNSYTDMNPDEMQPVSGGTYELVIKKNECWYNVSIEMQQDSFGLCEASQAPVLDQGSANCD